jgi:hypothetical protein
MDYGIFCLEVTQNADHCQFFSIREYFSKLFAYYLLLKAKVKRGW